jgi:hypothetical protein
MTRIRILALVLASSALWYFVPQARAVDSVRAATEMIAAAATLQTVLDAGGTYTSTANSGTDMSLTRTPSSGGTGEILSVTGGGGNWDAATEALVVISGTGDLHAIPLSLHKNSSVGPILRLYRSATEVVQVELTGQNGVVFEFQSDISSGNAFEINTVAASELTASSGTQGFLALTPEINQTSTAGYTGILLDVTETATGSGAKNLLDLQVGSASKFSVSNVGDASCRVLAATSQVTAPVVGDSGNYFSIRTSADDGAMFSIGSGSGTVNRHLILTDYANRAKDHDHDTLSTNPTVFIHSATDPDSDNTQWMSLSHDQTDGVIDVGTGSIRFADAIITPTFTLDTAIPASSASLGPSAPGTVVQQNTIGLGFDPAGSEYAYIEYEVPDEWDGASDIKVKVYWEAESGDAVAAGETVTWLLDYNSIAWGTEVYDNGTEASATVTYTQAGGGDADKQTYESEMTLPYNDADQPIAAGDLIVVRVERNSSDSYTGEAIAVKFEFACDVTGIPSHH